MYTVYASVIQAPSDKSNNIVYVFVVKRK